MCGDLEAIIRSIYSLSVDKVHGGPTVPVKPGVTVVGFNMCKDIGTVLQIPGVKEIWPERHIVRP